MDYDKTQDILHVTKVAYVVFVVGTCHYMITSTAIHKHSPKDCCWNPPLVDQSHRRGEISAGRGLVAYRFADTLHVGEAKRVSIVRRCTLRDRDTAWVVVIETLGELSVWIPNEIEIGRRTGKVNHSRIMGLRAPAVAGYHVKRS